MKDCPTGFPQLITRTPVETRRLKPVRPAQHQCNVHSDNSGYSKFGRISGKGRANWTCMRKEREKLMYVWV